MPSMVRGGPAQAQHLRQPRQPLGRVDEEHLRLDVLVDQAALLEALQAPELVAQRGRPLELQPAGGGLPSRAFSSRPTREPLDSRNCRKSADLRGVVLLRHLAAHGAVHCLMAYRMHGRKNRRASSPSAMSSLHVRNLKTRCISGSAARRSAGETNGP